MTGIAVVRNDGLVDVGYVRADGRYDVITLPLTEFETIRASFSGESCLVKENMAVDMTAIMDYIDETNPYFVQGQVTIETDKVRRSMGMGSFGKYLPYIIIGAVIFMIVMMFTQGSGDGGGAIGGMMPSTGGITGNVHMK